MKTVLIGIIILVVLGTFFTGLYGWGSIDPSYITAEQRKFYFILFIIGSVGLFILPIVFLTLKTLKDIKKSFESGESKITFNEWIYNLVPFRPIQVLINQAYPDEKIINKKQISFEGIAGLVRFGKLPVGAGYEIDIPFLARLYETNKSYYIDRRLQHFVLAPIEIGIIYLALADSRTEPLKYSNDIWVIFTYLFFAIFVTFIIIFRIFFQTGRIEMIRKSWLAHQSKGGSMLTLSGTIPSHSQISLSTDKAMNTGSINIPFAKTLHLI